MDRVLLVDDDTRLAEMVRTYLRSHGFDVDARSDGRSGLVAARATRRSTRSGFQASSRIRRCSSAASDSC